MMATPLSPALSSALALEVALPVRPVQPVSANLGQPATTGPEIPQPPAQTDAIAQAVQTASTGQSGLGALLADLTAVLQSPNLPPAVQAAAAQVLGFQLPIDPPPTAEDLRQAFLQSGLFLEAQLANNADEADGDLKAALLTLAQTLEAWTGGATGGGAKASSTLSPPYGGGPTQGQKPAQAGLTQDTSPDLAAARLMKETSGALLRQVLMQAASTASSPRATASEKGAQWLFEIPLATPQGPAVAQFEIDRDGKKKSDEDEDEAEATWRVKFSLDLDQMGPVHAKISLSGGTARVALWAENSETLKALTEHQDDLSQDLMDDALTPEVRVMPGAPAAATPPRVGRFMDRSV